MARRLGWPEAILTQLADFERLEPGESAAEKPSLGAAEKLALRLAEAMTLGAQAMSDDLYAGLRRHFDEGQIVELAAVIGLFNYFNRFNNALEMAPTQPGER